jgi:mono/diheme cytochrome c family protein
VEAGSLPPVLLAALSSTQKTGIALMAAAFIVFALVSSFVIPRRWPNFPGRHVWLYVGLVACFFVGMISVVIFVAREQPEAKAEPSKPTLPTPPPSPSPAPPPAPAGNAAAGKAVFASAGCAGCHTYTPAGSTGTTGPNLDNLATDAKTANRGPLPHYVTESIVDPNAYVVPKFPANVMPPTFGTTLTKQQIADLVAFLTKP